MNDEICIVNDACGGYRYCKHKSYTDDDIECKECLDDASRALEEFHND